MNQYFHSWQRYATLSCEKTCVELHTSLERGLTSAQVVERFKKYGPNELPRYTKTALALLLQQYTTVPSLILLIIGFLYAFNQNYAEAIVLAVILIGNGLLGFFQEYRADKSLQALTEYLSQPVQVVRSGKEEMISARSLVPGDVVTLRTGDIIPADMRVGKVYACRIDESSLTGESLPVPKQVEPLSHVAQTVLQAHTILFAGTEMSSGLATGIVIATGVSSGLGMLTVQTQAIARTSTFSETIAHINILIGLLICVSIALIVITHLIVGGIAGTSLRNLFLLVAALVVTIIPETLPLVITSALSQGALQLAKKGSLIVKRLSALADLGHMTILCADKTGTLTEHILSVAQVSAPDPLRALLLARLAGASPQISLASLRGFDRAIELYLSSADRALIKQYHRLAEAPFDPQSRTSMTAIGYAGKQEVILFGAPEIVIQRCHASPDLIREVQNLSKQAGMRGERVIAIATRPYTLEEITTQVIDEKMLCETYEGLITFVDPLKKSAYIALQEAQKLNVSVKIVSGDTVEVCEYVGKALGIIHDGDGVITGDQFMALSVEAQQEAAKKYHIFARCLPQHKAALVHMFKQLGSVGYVGDGINDTLPLREADVALAIYNAPRVVYEAADIIMQHKSLFNMVHALAEGRRVMHNLLAYLRISLSANLGNFYSIALAALVIDFPPEFPLHMLIVNLLSDLPLIALSTNQVHAEEIKQPTTFNRRLFVSEVLGLGALNSLCDLVFLVFFYRYEPARLGTAWVTWSALSELVLIFSLRSSLPLWRMKASSKLLIFLILLTASVVIALPVSSWSQQVLHYAPLGVYEYGCIGFSMLCALAIFECAKWVYSKRT